jgi:hypothetical protein
MPQAPPSATSTPRTSTHPICVTLQNLIAGAGIASADVGTERKNVEIDLAWIRIDIPCLHATGRVGAVTVTFAFDNAETAGHAWHRGEVMR